MEQKRPEPLLKTDEIEQTLLRYVNSNIHAYLIQLIDIKDGMFYGETTREVFKLFKKTEKDIRHYTYDLLEYHLFSSKELNKSVNIDKNVLKSICSAPSNNVTLPDIVTFIYLLKTNYIVKQGRLICNRGMEAITIKDVEKTALVLTKLLSLHKGEVKNDFAALANRLKSQQDPFPTNMLRLEEKIGGYYRSEMAFFHGLQSHGKSALLAWEISESIKKRKDKRARKFLSEMSELVYWIRILSKDLKKEMPIHNAIIHPEDASMLEEVYGNRLVIRSGYTAEEMVSEMVTDPRDMEAIDSLQYISRKEDTGTTSRIMYELNLFQNAITNTMASLIVVSHINESKVTEKISTHKASADSNALYNYCIPTDDMMSWSSACKQLGRRNLGILSPWKVTGHSADRSKLFVSLNKNTHGETTKFKLLFHGATTSFGNIL